MVIYLAVPFAIQVLSFRTEIAKMCFPCFTDRRRKSQRNQQNSATQGEQPIPLSTRSRNNARPPSRRGNNTAERPQAHAPHRQRTVSAVPPELEQDTDVANSQAFSNAPSTGIPSPPPRGWQGRSVSSTQPVGVRARSAGPNLATFSENEEEPEEEEERIPLRGDLQGLPSVLNQRRAERQRNQDHGIDHQGRQRNASNFSGLRFGHPSGTPEPHPGTLVRGSLTQSAAPSAQPTSSSRDPAARDPEPRFSFNSDSDGTEVPNAATPPPTASSLGTQVAPQTEPQSHFSDSSSSGEEEPYVTSALSSSGSVAEPGYGTRTNFAD